jgi:glutathione S-transferase
VEASDALREQIAGGEAVTTAPVHIVGSYLSPYVRKVLVALHRKGIAYEIDPIVPFFGDTRFTALSPLRRIPVLRDDRVTLCDSTVICEYLDDRHPDPPLRPADPAERARSRWLEEFADTRMGEVIIWRLFNQVAIGPHVWGTEPDTAILQHTHDVEMPAVLDYLEAEVPGAGFLFGDALGIADISIATFFRNAEFARYRIDAERWPRAAAFVAGALGHEAFQRLIPFENVSTRTPIPGQRAALAEAGAPLSAETFATDRPQRGIMSI